MLPTLSQWSVSFCVSVCCVLCVVAVLTCADQQVASGHPSFAQQVVVTCALLFSSPFSNNSNSSPKLEERKAESWRIFVPKFRGAKTEQQQAARQSGGHKRKETDGWTSVERKASVRIELEVLTKIFYLAYEPHRPKGCSLFLRYKRLLVGQEV